MRCYSHLSDDEREQIGLARTLGHSIGAIAQAIGRPKSTISRELSRNKLPSGRYSPLHAAGAYPLRLFRADVDVLLGLAAAACGRGSSRGSRDAAGGLASFYVGSPCRS
jgi:Helix-turn-helix domain